MGFLKGSGATNRKREGGPRNTERGVSRSQLPDDDSGAHDAAAVAHCGSAIKAHLEGDGGGTALGSEAPGHGDLLALRHRDAGN